MIYTIGHSNLSMAQFLQLLRVNGFNNLTDAVIDVRSHPGSSHVPQFNIETMDHTLREGLVGYIWQPSLGGWSKDDGTDAVEAARAHGVDTDVYTRGIFPKQRIAKQRAVPAGEVGWTNWGFYDYSWYMTSKDFRRGIEWLVATDAANPDSLLALCCGEALWWKCHRSMIADVLTAHHGVRVEHIMPNGKTATHQLRDRLDRYDTDIIEKWNDWWGR